MKIFVSHSKELNYKDELYKVLRASLLNEQHDFFLPHEGDMNVKTKEVIQSSDLVLAEVSYPATGQGIELGWADAEEVPIICFSKIGSKISGSLKYLTSNFAVYENMDDMLDRLGTAISGFRK